MKFFNFLITSALVFALLGCQPETRGNRVETVAHVPAQLREIAGTIHKGETLSDIFRKNDLNAAELYQLREASAPVHKLRHLHPGRAYIITVDEENKVRAFSYWITDDSILRVDRDEGVYQAEKVRPDYETRIGERYVVVKDNLISSMGNDRHALALALQLSDIFAWDVDFTSDLQNGDVFKIIMEELYLDGDFRKYGEVLSAEFIGSAESCRAYRFETDGRVDYYDDEGKSMRKAFLKAPLSIRRITSGFSKGRFHPVLKKYRPHHGVDYAAPVGTPVAALGSGTVVFSGRQGGYGNLVTIRHRNGYTTRYGHLSRIAKGARRGAKVEQGEIIGYVGRTGLATGPHLHFEMIVNGKPVNPMHAKIPRGTSLPKDRMGEFRSFKDRMNEKLGSIPLPEYAGEPKQGSSGVAI